ALKEDHPKTYVVKRGDTLWSISSIFLEDPWLWPELWHYNQQLDDPHLIYPGDILYLIWVDGKPRLVKSIATKTIENRDVKLSPQMRIADLQQAIPAISLDVIGPFLSNSRVVDLDTLERAPYVLSGREGHIVTGAGDTLYARGEFGDDAVFGIFRRSQ
ncbi:MAG TPA: peptidoglycan-binding protein, partial [Spongiibacteraceae bacterium]|nr:peptidoglycan-binding protein [Spongiibacteraceae bacterium]